MKKEDWIEVLNSLNTNDWTDWVIIGVSIISPILVLISVIYTARAANAAKKAADLNLKMYVEQKEEREKSFLPTFKATELSKDGQGIHFKLTNHNDKAIVITNYGYEVPIENFLKHEKDNYVVFTVYDDFTRKDYFKLWLYYTTLDHRGYCSELVFRIIDEDIVIQTNKLSRN